jgi:YVTN family beta-propeller protein
VSEFDDKLSEALKSVGESFRPEDIATKQRQFMKRRKRRRLNYFGGSLALGAAVIAAVLFVTSGTTPVVNKDEDKPAPPAGRAVPVITDVIEVGDDPNGIAVGPTGVWVANTEDDTVTRIDPSTDEVVATVPVTDRPDDVAVGNDFVWVGDDANAENPGLYGSVSIVDPNADRFDQGDAPPEQGVLVDTRLALSDSEGDLVTGLGHIDLVSSGSRLWAAAEAVPGINVFGSNYTNGARSVFHALPGGARDIALDPAHAWASSPSTGALYKLDLETEPANAPFEEFAPLEPLNASANDDLAAGAGAVWFTQGAEIARIDSETGEVTNEIQLPGNYAGIAVGEAAVWAISGEEDTEDQVNEQGYLTQIDSETGEPVGRPLAIDGKPADVAVGAGAIWITQARANTVTKVELKVVDASPAPDSSPTSDGTQEANEYPLFVYVSEGDVWAQYEDNAENLTNSPELETEPTISPDGRIVVYERRGSKDGSTEIMQLDLARGGEPTFLFEGANPSIGPDGKLAWVVPADRGPAKIGTALVGSRVQKFFQVGDPNSEPVGVDDLSWSKNGERLFYVSSYEGYALDLVDVSESFGDGSGPDLSGARWLQPDDAADGPVYIAPSNAYETNVIRLCCSRTVDDAYSTASFGVLHKGDGVASFTEISDLDAIDMGPYAERYTGFLGNIEMNASGSWVEVPSPAWFFGDGRNVWRVDAKGNFERIPFDFEVTGFAAPNPLYR